MTGSRLIAILLFSLPLLASSETDMASFQKVWQTVKEQHWDLKGTGVDWDQIHETYKARMEKAESRAETRRILSEMLGELGQSHFRILEGEHLRAVEALTRQFHTGTGSPGFTVAVIDGRVFMVSMEPEADAAAQGLAIGTEVLALDGKDLKELVSALDKAYEDSPHRKMYTSRTISQLFTGAPGASLGLTVAVDGKPREMAVRLDNPKGKFIQLLNIPSVYYEYESKMLPGNIGYIHFNVFTLDSKMSFEKDLAGSLSGSAGLILDLRGNPGGMGLVSSAIAGRLISEKGKKLGTMTNTMGTLNFAVFPQSPSYDKPVALLIDEGSASTSEILAAGLQDLGRVRVFGTRSAGAALPSIIDILPNGDRFQYAIGDYISTGGRLLEGKGVVPDEVTPHNLESLARKEDATMKAAIGWIVKKGTGAENEGM